MLQLASGWAAAALFLLIVDAIWLGLVARDFYFSRIGALMREDVWLGVASIFYIFYSLGVVILVSLPATRGDGLPQALIFGAVLGLCAYGTYDITNLATIKGWPVSVVVVDMAWGAFITAMTAGAGYLAMRALGSG